MDTPSIGDKPTASIGTVAGQHTGTDGAYTTGSEIPSQDMSASQGNPPGSSSYEPSSLNSADPMNLGRHRRENISKRQMKIDHPAGNKRMLKKYYTRQNELIDQFLGAEDEEANQVEEDAHYKPKIKFAVFASFSVNFCLFIIQFYAAISTGSLSVRSLASWSTQPFMIYSNLPCSSVALCNRRRRFCKSILMSPYSSASC